jgi:lysophospholipase L1-like esterase
VLPELVLRPIARTLFTRALTAPQVRATDEPSARSGSTDPTRVLLLGSGITSGWGVHTHGLALVGRLQRNLQDRLNRPVDVEQVSALGATLSEATDLLGDRATEQWDAIVVAFGLSDAMRLTPTREWAQALDRLLAKLDGDMPRGVLVPIIIAGMPPTDSIGLMTPLRSIFRRQPERLNLLSRRAVERNRRTVFVPLPPMANSAERPQGSPEAYRVWAEVIASAVAPLISNGLTRQNDPRTAPRTLRRLTAAALDPVNAGIREELGRIASRTQSATDADLVLISLTSADRLWSVATSVQDVPHSVALDSTFCAVTLEQDFLRVPDMAEDPHFLGGTVTQTYGFNSYAGVALRDAAGHAVGTLCMFNGGTDDDVDEAMLRRAGAEVEEELALLQPAVLDDQTFTMHGDVAPATLEPVPAPGSIEPRVATVRAAAERWSGDGRIPRAVPGAVGRRIRLSAEGRRLARTGEARQFPAARDLRIQGPDPIRVLLVGGDYSVGFGVTDRSVSLDGALARLLHTRTGRGVLVENRSRHLVPLEQLAASLGPAGAHTFDLVVWAPTFTETARLLLRTRWVAGIGMMLRKVQTTSEASVVLIGIPSLLGGQPIAAIGRARAAQINRLLARIAARYRDVVLVEPPPIVLGDVDRIDGAEVYRSTAVRILPAAMRMLTSPQDR